MLVTASALGRPVELRVVDRGPGVPRRRARSGCSTPFQRLGDTPAGDGVGLGLAVARGLADAVGGALVAEDTPGGGLTMVVSMPTADAARSCRGRRVTQGAGRRRRADRSCARWRSTCAPGAGRSSSAHDGRSALELAAGKHPDVVVLDLGLPDLDGVEVIRGLRGWTRVPIIVLSARQDSDDKVEALDAGADDYVTKPFGMDELLARLRAAIRRVEPSEDEAVVTAGDLSIDLARKKVEQRREPTSG